MRATFTLCLLLTFVSIIHAEADKPWTCPDEHIYVKCGELHSNYDYYGKPTLKYYDKHVEIYGPYEEEWLDQCGLGKIVRKWRIKYHYDWFWCTQTIHVQSYGSSFGSHYVQWPKNYDAHSCTGSMLPNEMPQGYDEPKIGSYHGCAKIGYTYDDKVFQFNSSSHSSSSYYGKPPCKVIHRKWEVQDWCSKGVWYHTQHIYIYDDKLPTITSCPEDVEIKGNDCYGEKVFVDVASASATDNCGDVKFFYRKKMIEDNTFSFESDPYGGAFIEGDNASGYFHPGKTEVTVKAVDICGNFEECYYFVDVNFKDNVPPTPVAISTITANLMKIDDTTGMVEINPEAFNSSSYDNCTAEDKLKFSLDKSVFTCDDIGSNDVKFIVEDEAGNTDTAHLEVIIQASHVMCPGGTISGRVVSNTNGIVKDAEIHLSDGEMVMTDENGFYHFEDISAGNAFVLESYKNDDVRYQVNMLDYVYLQLHLEGSHPINDPESLIAADVDNNGELNQADLDKLFNVIIGLDQEFENNESWKFYTSGFQFTNDMEPLKIDLPRTYAMDVFPGGDLVVDFNAIKIGDISSIGNELIAENENPEINQKERLLQLNLEPTVRERLQAIGSTKSTAAASPVISAFNGGLARNSNSLAISQNRPNPFTETTSIEFSVPERSDVEIKVVDISGRQVYNAHISDANGPQQITLASNVFDTPGIYTLYVQTTEEIAQLRMIKVQ